MDKPATVIGLGEIGGVFARGLLKTGHPVYPIVRGMDMTLEADAIPEPEIALVAVAEGDLRPVVSALPHAWRDRVVLIQNELLPRDWEAMGLETPTVVSVWFEKKKGQDAKVVLPSPIFGPRSEILRGALNALEIPSAVLQNPEELLFELVRKNLYILTTNICGLETGGTVSALWSGHRSLAQAVAQNVLDLQEWLVGESLDRERLLRGMVEAFEGDPDHKCMGRSAPARLERALALAERANLAVDHLRRIQQSQDSS